MRSFNISRPFAFLPLVCLTVGMLLTPSALAQNDGDLGCTLETFNGTYSSPRLTFPDGEEGISHAIVIGGLWRADGQGRIPYVKEFQKLGPSQRTQLGISDEDAGTFTRTWTDWGEKEPQERVGPNWTYTYTLEPDCTGQIFRAPPGREGMPYLGFTLTNGGRDGIVHSARDTAPYISLGTLRRIDNADQELEDRVARIEDLIIRLAGALGIHFGKK